MYVLVKLSVAHDATVAMARAWREPVPHAAVVWSMVTPRHSLHRPMVTMTWTVPALQHHTGLVAMLAWVAAQSVSRAYRPHAVICRLMTVS